MSFSLIYFIVEYKKRRTGVVEEREGGKDGIATGVCYTTAAAVYFVTMIVAPEVKKSMKNENKKL